MSDYAFTSRPAVRRFFSKLFEYACLAATLFAVLVLALMLGNILYHGLKWLSWDFVSSFASRFPSKAGIKAPLWGSLWVIGLTTVFAVPIGVASALYLEEYAPRTRLRKVIETNISNLAGVPSIVYGILGLAVFVRYMALDRSVLAGALTLTLVILPIVIISAQEALRAVPMSIRHSSYALGATRWQTVWHQVLPAATPGIMTGVILALSRALGEAAPLVTIGAVAFLAFTPTSPMDSFTVLPMQIFNWSGRPNPDFHSLAAAGIIVLMTFLLCMNSIAVFIRHRYSKRLGKR